MEWPPADAFIKLRRGGQEHGGGGWGDGGGLGVYLGYSYESEIGVITVGLKGLISFDISTNCSIGYLLVAFTNTIKIKSASFRCHGRCQNILKQDPLNRGCFLP